MARTRQEIDGDASGGAAPSRAARRSPVAPPLLTRGVEPRPADPGPARGPRAIGALLVASSAAYFWATTAADEDLWNHVHFGDVKLRTLAVPHVDTWSYSAPGHPWFNHEWGTEVVFAILYRLGGAPALVALKLAVGVAILAAMLDAARTLRRRTGDAIPPQPAIAAAVLVLAFAALAPGASFRPQLATMLALAIEWALLLRADARLFDGAGPAVGWELAAVPLVVLAWTNAHGGFPVGVALAATFVGGVLVRSLAARWWREPVPPARAVGLVVASGVATLAATVVNPYGIELHRYLATTLAEHGRITEWMPIPLWPPSHAPFELLVLATLACTVPWLAARPLRSARIDWTIAFVVLATAMAFRQQRHSVLATIVATPILLVAAEHVRRRAAAAVPALVPRPRVVAAIAVGVLGVAVVQLAQVTARFAEGGLAIRYARDEFPADAIAFLDAHDVAGNLAVQFEWGGYTLLHVGDRVRVFLDGRYEASYPPAVIDDYFAFVEAQPGWARVLDAYPTDGVVLDRTAAVVPLLDRRADFVRVYGDATAVVYLRRTEKNAAAIASATAVAARGPDGPPLTAFP